MIERWAAHEIIFEGRTYKMSVIELADGSVVRICPLTDEIHSTRFFNGCICVAVRDSRLQLLDQFPLATRTHQHNP